MCLKSNLLKRHLFQRILRKNGDAAFSTFSKILKLKCLTWAIKDTSLGGHCHACMKKPPFASAPSAEHRILLFLHGPHVKAHSQLGQRGHFQRAMFGQTARGHCDGGSIHAGGKGRWHPFDGLDGNQIRKDAHEGAGTHPFTSLASPHSSHRKPREAHTIPRQRILFLIC